MWIEGNGTYGCIYMCRNRKNNKKYVGQTVNKFEVRKKRHHAKVALFYFDRELVKHPNDFEWTIVGWYPIEDLDKQEIYWIAYYDTYKNGYNSTLGGAKAIVKLIMIIAKKKWKNI